MQAHSPWAAAMQSATVGSRFLTDFGQYGPLASLAQEQRRLLAGTVFASKVPDLVTPIRGMATLVHSPTVPAVAGLAARYEAAGISTTVLGGLRANFAIAGLADQLTEINPLRQLAQQMIERADTRSWLLATAVAAAPHRRLLSARPLSVFQQLMDRLANGDAAALPTFTRSHEPAVDALVARDVLVRPLDSDDLDEVIDVVEHEIIDVWQEARSQTGADLHGLLAAINPKLAELFCGSWHTLGMGGPGAIESTCHLILETLQRTLRALAPDKTVIEWAAGTGLSLDQVTDGNNVTQSARLRYALRGRKGERKLVVAEVEAVCASVGELVGRLNAGKHASAGDLAAVRANLLATESVLLRVLQT